MPPPHPRTRLAHAGTRRSQFGEMSEALFLTQSFAYSSAEAAEARFIKASGDDFIYARHGNPTVAMFEDRIAALERAGAAFATASGMAAVSGVLMAALSAGDHVVSSRALFGSCLYVLETILPKFGIEVTFVDGSDIAGWQCAVRPNTRLFFLETIANPTLDSVDIAAVAKLAREHGVMVVVDNVFVTPVLSRAFELGADVVVYSTTKHVDGQGRMLGGVILSDRAFIDGTILPFMKHTGGAMNPFTAWVMLKGLETLHLRVEAQCRNAEVLAEALIGHPKLSRMIYPGHHSHPQHALVKRQMGRGGTMLSLELAGGKEAAFRFVNALQIIKISNNLGDTKSIITHPATTTHQRLDTGQQARLGITPGLLRMSLGIEDARDLVADVMRALELV